MPKHFLGHGQTGVVKMIGGVAQLWCR